MKANNATEKVILDYFDANASDDLKKRVEAEKKTITGALKYCASQAQNQKIGNCACVDDATVFGWVMHYFEDEDAKKWESAPKKANVKAGSSKKVIAAKKEAATGEGCEDPAMVTPPPKRPPVLAVRPLSELPPITKRERRERDSGQLFLFDAEGGEK